MAAASTAGTIGHLSATFLPVFGIIAAFALTGNPVWGMGVAPAVIMMIICALLRGITRYIEQYLNHNVAFPDVYLEVQHPCWSCNSNSSSANASAGVR